MISGSVAQNPDVSHDEEPNAPLNYSLTMKLKLQMKNCSPRELCRDVVGRQYL